MAPAVPGCLAPPRPCCHATAIALRDPASVPIWITMSIRSFAVAASLVFLALTPVRVSAQTVYPPPESQQAAQSALAPATLDQLVAPVALYPDAVLAQILAASTYPLEVVQAHRWISQPQNASLTNGALTEAVAGQDWDPSVQALIPFPQVLQLMDDHLDWTEQLGEAFLAQPGDVMNAVQRLRHRAEQAGSLKITPEQSVVNEGDDIAIASPDEQSVYVPSYDPQCAYGAWPYPAPGPIGFAPWSGGCNANEDALSYDNATYLPFGFFLWASFDWHRRCILIDHQRFALAQPGRGLDSDEWRHDPVHRRGAGYARRVNIERFGAPARGQPFLHSPAESGFAREGAERRDGFGHGAAPLVHEGFTLPPPRADFRPQQASHAAAMAARPGMAAPVSAPPAMAAHGVGMPR